MFFRSLKTKSCGKVFASHLEVNQEIFEYIERSKMKRIKIGIVFLTGLSLLSCSAVEVIPPNILPTPEPTIESKPISEATPRPNPTQEPTPIPTPEPTPTPTPTPEPTPTPTPTPEPTPTPTPTPEPTPIPTPTPAPSLDPIPSGYFKPTGLNKCRARFSTKISAAGSVIRSRDFQSPVSFSLSHQNDQRYVILFSVDLQYPMLYFNIPYLQPGIYLGDQNRELNDPRNASLIAYRWSSNLTEFSFDSSISDSKIEIKGNDGGYIWGDFDGVVGTVGSYTVLMGKFVCVP